jgi:hypothetical protein
VDYCAKCAIDDEAYGFVTVGGQVLCFDCAEESVGYWRERAEKAEARNPLARRHQLLPQERIVMPKFIEMSDGAEFCEVDYDDVHNECPLCGGGMYDWRFHEPWIDGYSQILCECADCGAVFHWNAERM